MWRFFLIYVALFAAVSLPGATLKDWQLFPIGIVFAAGLVLIPAGISRSVQAWPHMVPRLIIATMAITTAVIACGVIWATHPLVWTAIIAYAGTAAILVLIGIAIAGWTLVRR